MGEWQPIEAAPTGDTLFLAAWRHPKAPDGWMFEVWSGAFLVKTRDAFAKGLNIDAPHLYYMPTHWQPITSPKDEK